MQILNTPQHKLKERFFIFFLLVFIHASAKLVFSQSVDEGKTIFQQKCVSCHTIGGGKMVGPDLQGVTQRREKSWLTRWISEPEKMLAEKDPIATQLLKEHNNVPMTNLSLKPTEVASIIAYLEMQSGVGKTTEGAPKEVSVPLPSGNSVLGRDLFTGVIRFKNGGPPCMACHSIAGLGALGGGALGPDLTGAFTKFGEEGIVSILSNIPFLTMLPIFKAHPLTEKEQANIRTFLQAASVIKRTHAAAWRLFSIAITCAFVLTMSTNGIWRKRLNDVRRPMYKKSTTDKGKK